MNIAEILLICFDTTITNQ